MRVAALTLSLRGLRIDARRPVTYALRIAAIGVLMIGLFVAYHQSGVRGAPGQTLFTTVVFTDFFLLSLLGISLFSSAITEEKEDQTLGLLKLAGFGPGSVMLGKSVSQLWTALTILFAQIPFVLLSITLGGVGSDQVLAAFVLLGAYSLFVYAIGLLASTICRRNSQAAAMTVAVLLSFFFGPPLLALIVGGFTGTTPSGAVGSTVWSLCGRLIEVSAFTGLVSICAVGYQGELFSTPVIGNLAVAVVFFALAWLAFEPFTKNEQPPSPKRGWDMWRPFSKNRPIARVWNNALLWKECRFQAGGVGGIIVRFVLYAGLLTLFGLVEGINRVSTSEFGVVIVVTMLWAIPIELGIYASRMFREEVQWKTLPALVTLPMTLGEVAFRKILGAFPTVLPACVYLLIGLGLAGDRLGNFGDDLFEPGVIYFVSNVVLGLHLTVLYSLAFRRGALVLAFLSMVAWNVVFLMMASTGASGEGPLVFGAFVLFGGTALLYPVIGERLRYVAGSL